jgi:hypothetical protein
MQAKTSRGATCVVAFSASIWAGTGAGWVAAAQSAPTLGDRERIIVGPYLKPVNEPQVSHLSTIHGNTFIIMWQTGHIPSGSATESPRNVEYIAPEYNPSTGEFDWNVTGLAAFPMPMFSQTARDPAVVALIEGVEEAQYVGGVELLTGTDVDILLAQAVGGTVFSTSTQD